MNIPEQQWSLPVSFENGKSISLREYINNECNSFDNLTLEQKKELTIARIDLTSNFEVGTLGPLNNFMFDKNQAIAEVKACSDFGNNLVDIEMMMISKMIKKALLEKRVKKIVRSQKEDEKKNCQEVV